MKRFQLSVGGEDGADDQRAHLAVVLLHSDHGNYPSHVKNDPSTWKVRTQLHRMNRDYVNILVMFFVVQRAVEVRVSAPNRSRGCVNWHLDMYRYRVSARPII